MEYRNIRAEKGILLDLLNQYRMMTEDSSYYSDSFNIGKDIYEFFIQLHGTEKDSDVLVPAACHSCQIVKNGKYTISIEQKEFGSGDVEYKIIESEGNKKIIFQTGKQSEKDQDVKFELPIARIHTEDEKYFLKRGSEYTVSDLKKNIQKTYSIHQQRLVLKAVKGNVEIPERYQRCSYYHLQTQETVFEKLEDMEFQAYLNESIEYLEELRRNSVQRGSYAMSQMISSVGESIQGFLDQYHTGIHDYATCKPLLEESYMEAVQGLSLFPEGMSFFSEQEYQAIGQQMHMLMHQDFFDPVEKVMLKKA